MARIAEEVIRRIEAEVSVLRLAELAGVELRPEGENLVGSCPFHPDEDSSLHISPQENAWRCSGECEAGGSPIEWTMRAEGVSFPHAVELLRDGALPSTPRSRRSGRSTVAKLPQLLPQEAGERELLERVVDFYAQTLSERPEALACLKHRGLGDPALIERFRLGYANRTLGYRLPMKNRKAGKELRGKLKSLGVLRDSGHEHLSGSLVVPICDEDGAVTQLYGRKTQEKLRAGTPLHLYLPGPRGLFNASALRADSEAILCESPIDALTFWTSGLRGVVATPGPDACGEELCAALAAAGTERALIAFDADSEGERGAEALAARLGEAGIECLRVRFPAGEDANSFACAAEEPATALGRLVREAEPIGAGEPAAAAEEEPPAAPVSWEEDDEEPEAQEPASPPTASSPQANSADPVVEAEGEELRVQIEERRWRVRGVGRATSFESLRVNLLVARQHPRGGEVFHLDTLDLYSARSCGSFARAAAKELGLSEELVARDLGRVLMACEECAEQAVREAQAPAEPRVELSEAERERALGLLRDPALIERICADFERIATRRRGGAPAHVAGGPRRCRRRWWRARRSQGGRAGSTSLLLGSRSVVTISSTPPCSNRNPSLRPNRNPTPRPRRPSPSNRLRPRNGASASNVSGAVTAGRGEGSGPRGAIAVGRDTAGAATAVTEMARRNTAYLTLAPCLVRRRP